MSEAKDPAIKLFGKTIPLLEIAAAADDEDLYSDTGQDLTPCTDTGSAPMMNKDGEEEVDKDTLERKLTKTTLKEGASTLTSEHYTGLDETAGTNETPKTPSMDNETATLKSSKNEEDQNDTGASDDKTLKKPDKIIPCPRCTSMDTKFCYYNNYNVNQPRHFCRKCQRYWTAGGTMRNVPVGAGRRKNKNSASHITVPEPIQSVLSQKLQNCTTNGFNVPQNLIIPVSYEGTENVDCKLTNIPSMTTLNSKVELSQIGMQGLPMMQNYQNIPPQGPVPCFPGAPWAYAWPSGYPMPFYPVPTYWGCGVPGAWAVPWMPQPSSPNGLTSPLGKHSRDEEVINPSNNGEGELPKVSKPDRCLWIPKTLRIDDPGEAAKSSIWETLGIKNELGDSEGLFKAFKSKGDEKNHVPKSSPVLQANPAAMSRSINFHERS